MIRNLGEWCVECSRIKEGKIDKRKTGYPRQYRIVKQLVWQLHLHTIFRIYILSNVIKCDSKQSQCLHSLNCHRYCARPIFICIPLKFSFHHTSSHPLQSPVLVLHQARCRIFPETLAMTAQRNANLNLISFFPGRRSKVNMKNSYEHT